MRFPEASIENLRTFGYTGDEARFLYVAATHSGYFSTRQFLQFTGAKSGDRSMSFSQKLLGKGHATARLLLRNGRVYHLSSRAVYRALGRGVLRNRREHSVDHIRTRLVALDFVLAHLDYRYLETEADKLDYFCKQRHVPRPLLPVKRYTGAIRARETERYFVDNFPIFLAPGSAFSPVVTFTFIDSGLGSLDSFETHLLAYDQLFQALHGFRFVYIAIRPTHFDAAEKTFLALADRTPRKDPGWEISDYFRLRKAWEAKQYGLFTDASIMTLHDYTKRFENHPCQERYPAWRDGQISTDLVRSEFHDLTPQEQVRFETSLVDGQAGLFEVKPQRHANSQGKAI
jgi:hypothetical protein